MKPVINMRFLTMIFTILLIIAFLSMAWPFILAMLVIMAVLGIFGMFKIKKMTKTMNDQWSSMDQNQDSVWIDEQTQDRKQSAEKNYVAHAGDLVLEKSCGQRS